MVKKTCSRLWKPLLILLIAAGVLVFLYHCPFRYFFGVACPGCGMTRALLAAVFSDPAAAFAFHPLWPFMIPAGLYVGLKLFCGMRVPARRENVYIILLAAAMIGVYIVRVVSGDPVVQPDTGAALFTQALDFLKTLRA